MVWRFIPRCYRRSARSRKRETIRLACDVWQRGAGYSEYPAETWELTKQMRRFALVPMCARVFALKTAYRAVRPDSPTSGAATLLLSVALSRQMTDAFTTHHYSRQQKQDARDYYVIVRALIQPAVQQVPGAGAFDPNARRSLTAFARAFLLKDTAAYAVQ
jgi:hypothetical protein